MDVGLNSTNNNASRPEKGLPEAEDVWDISDESSFYGDDDLCTELERHVAEYDPSSYWLTGPPSLHAIAAAYSRSQSTSASLSKPLYNRHEGDPSGRQLSESIPEFLTRLPPSTTLASAMGPWIWIANPYSDARPLQQDLAGLMDDGTRLLDDCGATMVEKEVALQGRPQSLVARQLTAVRKTATDGILAAACIRGVTSGKWMLFPMPRDVNAVWRVVADATASGQLGSGAKVATKSATEEEEDRQSRAGTGRPRVVCEYTRDFADEADVQRVVRKLDQLGLVRQTGPSGEGRGIHYKCGALAFNSSPFLSFSFQYRLSFQLLSQINRIAKTQGLSDAFTHLGIESGNRWGIKPSRYSSREILNSSQN
ncbi:hypothetical protein MMC07_001386 [Pseudocyphellaria aurata]|nr:hypothetical protein [Pseudocyphellaria aurata]